MSIRAVSSAALCSHCLGLLLIATAGAQSLVPAGSINGALSPKPTVVLTEDDAAVVRFVTAIRDRFFQGAEIVAGAKGGAADLRGKSAVVYATPQQPWVSASPAAICVSSPR
jgi:hypothetical protein